MPSVRDRSGRVPRWALDGGQGSVVSVEDMDNDTYRQAWLITKALVDGFDGYMFDLEQVSNYMDTVLEVLNSRD